MRTTSALTPSLLLLLAGAGFAVDAAPQSVDDRINELDQQVKVLNRKAEIAAEEAAAKAKAGAKVFANDNDGYGIASNDGSFKLRLRGLVQTDGRIFLNDDDNPLTSQFLIRNARFGADIALGKHIDASIIPDFTGTSTKLVDAYVDLKAVPQTAVLRIGKFATPIGLERWQSTPALGFAERSLASNLTPNRDVGAQLAGEFSGGTFGYAVGIFNGTADNGNLEAEANTTKGDGKDGIGRVSAKPFLGSGVDALEGLLVAFSASYGYENGVAATPALPNYASPGQNRIFAYNANAYADGTRSRLNPQVAWYNESFSVLGEYVRSAQAVHIANAKDTLADTGWFLSTGWVVTGEKASFKGVAPARPFDPASGGWGALEVIARIHQLAIDNDAFTPGGFASRNSSVSRATAYGVGVNWWLSKQVRVTTDYEYTAYTDGAAASGRAIDRESENLLVSRLQVAF